MKKHVETGDNNLSPENRNLLSVAYKNIVGSRRSAWRVMKSLEKKYQESNESQKLSLAEDYIGTIVEELVGIIMEVIVRETS